MMGFGLPARDVGSNTAGDEYSHRRAVFFNKKGGVPYLKKEAVLKGADGVMPPVLLQDPGKTSVFYGGYRG